jgi:O-antigen ligase
MRLDIWRMSTRIVRDFTLLGSGLDTFGTASILYQTAGKDLHYNEAHNDYLQVLVEGGFVTAALLVVALIGIVVSAMARLRSREDGVELHWIRLGALAGVGAVGLQSLVEFSLQMPGNAALFVVLLALVLFTPAAYRSQP